MNCKGNIKNIPYIRIEYQKKLTLFGSVRLPPNKCLTSISVPDQLGDQAQNAETVTIQQGGQAVYPTHVQYVDGSDPGIYANGQMYDIYKQMWSVCCGLHTGLSGSNA